MESKQVIVVRRDLNMPPGKLAAQVAHASIAFLSRRIRDVKWGHDASVLWPGAWNWINGSFVKVVLGVDSLDELVNVAKSATFHGLEVSIIEDEGRTVFDGQPTVTCIGIGPDFTDRFNGVTDSLELL